MSVPLQPARAVGAEPNGQDPMGGGVIPTPPRTLRRWVSVLQNSKDEALSSAFLGEPSGSPVPWRGTGLDGEPQDVTKLLISEVKSRPGNRQCCDCGAAGPGLCGRAEEGGGSGGEGPAPQALAAVLCRPHVAQHQPGRAHLHPVLWRPPRAGRALLAHSVPHLGPAGPLRVIGENGVRPERVGGVV